MAQVTLGNKSFDEGAEEIDASFSRVSDADCAALGAAMAAGKFKRLKKLNLVSWRVVLIAVSAVDAACCGILFWLCLWCMFSRLFCCCEG